MLRLGSLSRKLQSWAELSSVSGSGSAPPPVSFQVRLTTLLSSWWVCSAALLSMCRTVSSPEQSPAASSLPSGRQARAVTSLPSSAGLAAQIRCHCSRYRETVPVVEDRARMSILGDQTMADTSYSVCFSSINLITRFCAIII